MLLLILRATLLLLLAFALDAVLRRAPALRRHLLWSLTLAALLALPLLTVALPRLALEVLPAPEPLPMLPTPSASPSVVPARPVPAVGVLDLLAGVWAVGALVGLGRLGLGLLAIGRLARRTPPSSEGETMLAALAAELGIARRVELLVCDRLGAPMTAGFWRPRIFLPAGSVRWSPERRRVVLLHELIHVRRGDWLLELFGQLCRALYWYHPLVWLALRRAALAREQACDEGVVGRGLRASQYARHLLEIAETPVWCPTPALALAMTSPTHLERRLMSILNAPSSHRRGLVSSLAIVLVLAVAALGLAAAEPKPARSTPPAAPAAPATPAPPAAPAVVPAPPGTPVPVLAPTPPAAPLNPRPPAAPAPPAPPDLAELSELSGEIAELHAELQAQHAELQAERAELEAERMALEEEHRALEQSTHIEAQRAALEAQRAELAEAREQLRHQREELENAREALRRERERLRERRDDP